VPAALWSGESAIVVSGAREDGNVVRRSARAILIDDEGRLVLIKRTKPGQSPYWTAPGGGVQVTDATPEAALRRELAEELGAVVGDVSRVFQISGNLDGAVRDETVYLGRLRAFDLTTRHGPELDDPGRGSYEIERIDLTGPGIAAVDLKPAALKDFVLANRMWLLGQAGVSC
jgi:8-oxo-dGTP pyrophosphatase MutT (NUDIX family)